MKIIQSNAVSLNGLIARENGEEDWLPPEGWAEFVEAVKRFNNFIMGRETYELVMRLFGGGKLNSSFYAQGLVDEPWITINPLILGKGRPFIDSYNFEALLKLTDIVRLNNLNLKTPHGSCHPVRPNFSCSLRAPRESGCCPAGHHPRGGFESQG